MSGLTTRDTNKETTKMDEKPPMPRSGMLGLDSVKEVGAGESVTIETVAQTRMKIERLVVSPDSAEGFVIKGVAIRGKSQMADGFPGMPASMYSESAQGIPLKLDEVQEGDAVSITVENTSPEPVRFTGMFIARILEPQTFSVEEIEQLRAAMNLLKSRLF